MNTLNSDSKITFGHFVPTEPLLKSALKLHKYEDAKILNNSLGVQYSGHISFYKRAITIANNIVKKNPEIEAVIKKINSLQGQEEQLQAIRRIKTEYGENIDVVID